MLWNRRARCSSRRILLRGSEVKPVQSVSWAQDGKPKNFIAALTDGRAAWWRGWWSGVPSEPLSQASPALQVHRCVVVLIWTPASVSDSVYRQKCVWEHILCVCVLNMPQYDSKDLAAEHNTHVLCLNALHVHVYLTPLAYLCVRAGISLCSLLVCNLIKALLNPGEPSIPTQPWSWSSGLCRISVNS